MADLRDDDADAQARKAGVEAGRRGAEPEENPHRRGGSPGDALFSPRLRRLWERGRLDGERERDDKARMAKMAAAAADGRDPWEAGAEWTAAAEAIVALVHRVGPDGDWSEADRADLARLQELRDPSFGPVISTYAESASGALVSTTPSRSERQLLLVRARARLYPPPGSTAADVDAYFEAHRAELLAEIERQGEAQPPAPLPPLRRSRKTGWDADRLEAEDHLRRLRSSALALRGGGGGSGGPGARREIIERAAEQRRRFRARFIGTAVRVVLISCSARKVEGTGSHPPRELYTGPLFRAALAYAEARSLPWAVLSAKHGLLLPSGSAQPYENKLTASEAPAWAARVVGQMDGLGLLVAGTGLPAPTWEIHAGAVYADALAALLTTTAERPSGSRGGVGGWRAPERVEQPLRGLQIGQRLAWYASRREGTA